MKTKKDQFNSVKIASKEELESTKLNIKQLFEQKVKKLDYETRKKRQAIELEINTAHNEKLEQLKREFNQNVLKLRKEFSIASDPRLLALNSNHETMKALFTQERDGALVDALEVYNARIKASKELLGIKPGRPFKPVDMTKFVDPLPSYKEYMPDEFDYDKQLMRYSDSYCQKLHALKKEGRLPLELTKIYEEIKDQDQADYEEATGQNEEINPESLETAPATLVTGSVRKEF